MKTAIRTIAFLSFAALGCEPPDAPIEDRAAQPCDAAVIAAERFRDAPADIPAEHAAATCLFAEQPWTCKESAGSETCCSPGYGVVGKGWTQTCCTNTQSSYSCKEKAGPLVHRDPK